MKGVEQPLLDEFAIADADPISSTPETEHPDSAAGSPGLRLAPDLHPPKVVVTANSPAVAPGDEFLAPYAGAGQRAA